MSRILLLLLLVLFALPNQAQAISFGKPGGEWPENWPKQLEKHRKDAWTWEHGFGGLSYDIPFKTREEFEAAWPHLVKLKSKGAPLTLFQGKALRVKNEEAVGVRILMPHPSLSEAPHTFTRIHLLVDGKIVDLNRIKLPADTTIIDQRFKEKK